MCKTDLVYRPGKGPSLSWVSDALMGLNERRNMDLEALQLKAENVYSPFGEVPGIGTPLHWLGPYDQSLAYLRENWPVIREQAISDGLRLDASGWRQGRDIISPDVITPGDGPAIRAAAMNFVPGMERLYDEICVGGRRQADLYHQRVLATALSRHLRLVTSAFAYLPATTAVTLLGAFRPDRELYDAARLPHRRMLVFFGSPLRFDATSTWWDEEHVRILDEIDLELARNTNLPLDLAEQHLVSQLWRRGGALVAIWMESDVNGKLLDEIGFVTFENNDGKLTTPTTTIGSLRRATLAPLVENLLCALCWGHWASPGPAPELPDPTTRAFRRLITTSSFKRQARSGSVDGVQLLELGTNTVRSSTTGPTTGTRTVSAHLRRGHFRRVRVVTRDSAGNLLGSRTGTQGIDWNYQGRWIPPTLVNPSGESGPNDRTRVYLLPEPPQPDEWDEHRRDLAGGDSEIESPE